MFYKKFFLPLSVFFFSLFLFPFFSQAVTVGPVRFEFSVDPGETKTGEILLLNEGTNPQSFYSSFERFTENENGEKIFFKENTGLSNWFTIPNSVTLNPGEQKFIPFSINIPNDAPPGGHFSVLWWGTASPQGSGLSIMTRAGILVYLRVSGDIKEKAVIEDFLPGKYFYSFSPIQSFIRFKNEGNVALSPRGTVSISNIFGIEKSTISFNTKNAIVLPGTGKNITVEIPFGEWFFGIYKVHAKIIYGEQDNEISKSSWLFIFSWKSLITFISILFFLFVFPQVIKRYNRWIIKKNKIKDI